LPAPPSVVVALPPSVALAAGTMTASGSTTTAGVTFG
jgi:hypothetical protein